MVPEWRQHCHKSFASIRQGEDAECIEDVCSVGGGGEQPLEVVFVDALREEGNDSKEPSGVRAEFLEHWRSKRKLDGGREAMVVLCAKHIRSLCIPLLAQPASVPFVVVPNRGK